MGLGQAAGWEVEFGVELEGTPDEVTAAVHIAPSAKNPLPGRSTYGIIEPMTETTDNKPKLTPDEVEAELRQIARNLPETDTCIPKLQKLYRAVTGLEHPFEDHDRAKYGKYLWDEIRNWIRDARAEQRLARADELAERADERADRMAKYMLITVVVASISTLIAIVSLLIAWTSSGHPN